MNIKTGDFQYDKSNWKTVRLGEVCKFQKGQTLKSENFMRGNVPVIAGGINPAGYHNEANRKGKTITISASGANAGYVALYKKPIFATDCSTISEDSNYNIEYLYFGLKSMQTEIYRKQTGGAQPHIHPRNLVDFVLPFPEIHVQHEIGEILSKIEKQIDVIEHLISKYESIKKATEFLLNNNNGRTVKLSALFSIFNWNLEQKNIQEPRIVRIITQSQREDEGTIPSCQNYIVPKDNYIIFGDHTCCVKKVSTPFTVRGDGVKIIIAGKNIDSNYLYLITSCASRKIPSGYARHLSMLSELEVRLPESVDKQRILAEHFSRIETLIRNLSAREKKLINIKKAMLQYFFGD
ncbi:MAG: restriction endonuclease subunit S [Oligosphaeraceae bacterium]